MIYIKLKTKFSPNKTSEIFWKIKEGSKVIYKPIVNNKTRWDL